MQKILLFYKFTPLADPDAVRMWQRTLADSLALKGRILLSKHGINATIGGDIKAVKEYVKQTKQFPAFKDIHFKWSDGSGNEFPRLNVKVRDEIVSFGAGDELQVNEHGVVNGGQHLKPEQVHELVDKYGQEVIFFDGRNAYEAQVGKFKNAIVPSTRTSKDFIRELDSGKYDAIKSRPIVTYCTGGIRCEILSSLMKNRGFEDVYQIDGGIVTYGEKYADDGLWEGSLYVFDDRMGLKFSNKAVDIGTCIHCAGKTSNFENCALAACNDLVLICESCRLLSDKLFHKADCRATAQLIVN